jgi:SAM-dependent MidA family methyltransferase
MIKLPAPSPEENRRVEALTILIERRISDDSMKSISFHDFMHMALYDSSYGYYSSNKYKLGHKGDFVTAPLVSKLFSYSFANKFATILKNPEFECSSIIEFGAGDGKFASDCLLKLEQMDALPERYIIIDTSADLINLQKKHLKNTLPDYYSHIVWCREIPNTIRTSIIFANEVLDSMPVELFKYYNNSFFQQRVIYEEKTFKFSSNIKIDSRLQSAILNTGILLDTLADSYISEVNLWIDPWLRTISNNLDNAVVFISDYGYDRRLYYHPDRNDGTLRCYYKHHVHDNPLINVGIQDITAHVDFTTVAESAVSNNFHLESYSQQNQFLISSGILKCYQELMISATQKEKILLTQELKKLTLSTDLCDTFKVMVLSLGRNKSIDLSNSWDLSYLL